MAAVARLRNRPDSTPLGPAVLVTVTAATGRDTDREVQPGTLAEVGGEGDGLGVAATGHAHRLPPVEVVPVDRIQVQRAAVAVGEAEPHPQRGAAGRCPAGADSRRAHRGRARRWWTTTTPPASDSSSASAGAGRQVDRIAAGAGPVPGRQHVAGRAVGAHPVTLRRNVEGRWWWWQRRPGAAQEQAGQHAVGTGGLGHRHGQRATGRDTDWKCSQAPG